MAGAETPPGPVPPNANLDLTISATGTSPPPPAASAETVPSPARSVPPKPGVPGTIRRSRCHSPVGQKNAERSSYCAARGADCACRYSGRDTCAAPGTPKSQYDYALSLMLGQRDFAAEAGMRAFVEQHPQDDLAGNARLTAKPTMCAEVIRTRHSRSRRSTKDTQKRRRRTVF